jgi:serine/threonine-protein kinase
VGAAHAAGLVHRDLKPENVLVDTQQGNLVARVTDFGLVSTDNLTLPRLTHSGVVLGTPAYMAPEQMRDAAAVDARADIFSLGCILYEVLCRRLAFPQGDFVRLVQAIEREEYLDPGILVPGLAPGLIRLVRDCLRADPELRPSSCVELAARLDEAVAAGPARGIPNTAADQVEAVHDDLSISSLPSAAIQYTPTRLEGGAPRQHTASLPAISLDGTETQTAARRRRIKVLGVAGVVCALVLVTGAWWLARTGVAASEVPPETGIEAELPGSMATGDEAAKVTRVPQPEGSSSPPVTSTGDENVIRASTAANQPVSILPTVGPQATAPSREAPPSTAPPTATEPASPTAAEPASRTQATGRVRFSGDATDVWLESGGRRYRGGAVPEGTYAAWASFGEAPAFNAGLITIVAGNSVVVKCAGAFQTCAVSE